MPTRLTARRHPLHNCTLAESCSHSYAFVVTRPVHTSLLVIGGAEDKVGDAVILRRFVRLAGGREARIVIIPKASSLGDEAVETYTAVLGRLGATRSLRSTRTHVLRPRRRH